MTRQHLNTSMKTKAVALLLTFFLGCWGVHWFYLGKSTKGAVYLCIGALGFFFIFPLVITGILSLIDFIIIIFKSEDDFDEEYNYDYIHTNEYQQPQQQFYQQPQQQQYTTPQQPTQQPQPKNDFSSKTNKLKDLKALLDAGVLTQEEFDSEKKKILNN